MTTNIVYLMRGLPGCGKSHMANRLAGSDGVVLETDQYFYTQVGDNELSYDLTKTCFRPLVPGTLPSSATLLHEASPPSSSTEATA